MDQAKKAKLALPAVMLSNVIWGSSNLFTRSALGVTRPVLLLAARFLVAFLTINLWLLLSGQRLRLRGRNLKPLLLLGVLEPLCLITESYGILYTNASFAGVMLALVPIFAIFLAAVFLREHPTRTQLLFCTLPIAGVIVITLAGRSLGVVSALGVLFLFIHCLGSGTFKTANRGLSQDFTPMERTYVMMLGCALVFTVAALISVHGDPAAFAEPFRDRRVLLPALYLGAVCSVTANMMSNFGATYISVTKASSLSALSTLTSAFGGVLILGEPVSALAALGAALIVLGVWQVTRRGT